MAQVARCVVLTGSPGGGKTTVLSALQQRGHRVAADSAREIIRTRRHTGLSPRPPPLAFAEAVLQRDVQQHAELSGAPGLVFFERGVVDALGMLSALGALPDARRLALLGACHYHRQVFLFPGWEAIYATDDERDQTFAQAAAVAPAAAEWYRRCGYDVVEVPRAGVDERCEFILRALS